MTDEYPKWIHKYKMSRFAVRRKRWGGVFKAHVVQIQLLSNGSKMISSLSFEMCPLEHKSGYLNSGSNFPSSEFKIQFSSSSPSLIILLILAPRATY